MSLFRFGTRNDGFRHHSFRYRQRQPPIPKRLTGGVAIFKSLARCPSTAEAAEPRARCVADDVAVCVRLPCAPAAAGLSFVCRFFDSSPFFAKPRSVRHFCSASRARTRISHAFIVVDIRHAVSLPLVWSGVLLFLVHRTGFDLSCRRTSPLTGGGGGCVFCHRTWDRPSLAPLQGHARSWRSPSGIIEGQITVIRLIASRSSLTPRKRRGRKWRRPIVCLIDNNDRRPAPGGPGRGAVCNRCMLARSYRAFTPTWSPSVHDPKVCPLTFTSASHTRASHSLRCCGGARLLVWMRATNGSLVAATHP